MWEYNYTPDPNELYHFDQGVQTGLGVSATIAGAAIGSRVSDPSKDKRLKKR